MLTQEIHTEFWAGIFKDLVWCPDCMQLALSIDRKVITCNNCLSMFRVRNGIPHLYSSSFAEMIDKFETNNDCELSINEAVLKANIQFHNKNANGYDKDPAIEHLLSDSGQSLIRECVNYCRQKTEGQVWIDAGCGTGQVLTIADKFPISIGFDISENMASIAKSKGHRVFLGDAYHIPCEEGMVDLVTACALLHHLENPRGFLLEAYRVLKPGGMLFTDFDPNNRPSHSSPLFRLVRQTYRSIKPKRKSIHTQTRKIQQQSHMADYHMYYNFHFNGEFVENILKEIGFSDIRVEYYFNKDGIDNRDKPQWGRLLRRIIMAPVSRIYSKIELAPLFFVLAEKPEGT